MLIGKHNAGRWVIGMLVSVMSQGCTCHPRYACDESAGQASLQTAVLSGFEGASSRLFVSKGRLLELLSRLGYDAEKYSYTTDHSSDGTSLRCWNRNRSGAIVITKDRSPRAITVPPGSFLDDEDKAVAWFGDDASDHIVTFRDGTVLFAPGFHLDASGRFFCYGGNYYDYEASAGRERPIRIAAVANPNVPLATSAMKGLLDGIFASEKRVFLVLRGADRVVCEEFAWDGEKLVRVRQFEARPPAWFAVSHVVPMDFDPVSEEFLLYVGRDLPLLGGPLWYVHDVRTGKSRKIGVFEGYAGFLDRHLFDRALEELRAP